MSQYENQIAAIVQRFGGYREKWIISQPHTITQGDTWSQEHKVIYITSNQPQPDGCRDRFSVDIVTNKICG